MQRELLSLSLTTPTTTNCRDTGGRISGDAAWKKARGEGGEVDAPSPLPSASTIASLASTADAEAGNNSYKESEENNDVDLNCRVDTRRDAQRDAQRDATSEADKAFDKEFGSKFDGSCHVDLRFVPFGGGSHDDTVAFDTTHCLWGVVEELTLCTSTDELPVKLPVKPSLNSTLTKNLSPTHTISLSDDQAGTPPPIQPPTQPSTQPSTQPLIPTVSQATVGATQMASETARSVSATVLTALPTAASTAESPSIPTAVSQVSCEVASVDKVPYCISKDRGDTEEEARNTILKGASERISVMAKDESLHFCRHRGTEAKRQRYHTVVVG